LPCSYDDIGKIGKESIGIERSFNEAAGFTRVHDRLDEVHAV